MIKEEIRQRIAGTVITDCKNHESAAKQAVTYGISDSALSRIKKGDIDNVLSDANWMNIARRLKVNTGDIEDTITAKTETFEYVYSQLGLAQKFSVSGMFCDRSEIGKSHAAKIYAINNKNAVYIDCGFYKTKQRWIKKIAQEFGVSTKGTYYSVFEALVSRLKTITSPPPLIILDEYGDLPYEIYLEHKAFYNQTDGFVAWYAMGADGLKTKIEGKIEHNKVGFAELFSRLGSRYRRVTDEVDSEFRKFQKKQILQIGRANGITDLPAFYKETGGSLRRIDLAIKKLKSA